MTSLMMVWNWMQDMLFLLLPVYISLRPLVLTSIAIGGVAMQPLLCLLAYHLETMEFQHLKIAKESYGKHLLFTVKLSAMLLLLAGCSVVHGIFPFLLTGMVSDKIKHLHSVLSER